MILHAQRGVDSVRLSPDGRWLLFSEGAAAVLVPAQLPSALSPAEILAFDPLTEGAL